MRDRVKRARNVKEDTTISNGVIHVGEKHMQLVVVVGFLLLVIALKRLGHRVTRDVVCKGISSV
jgi:hypothetical protein